VVLVIIMTGLLTGLGAAGNAMALSLLLAGLLAGCGRALWFRAARP
jgi:hypothetical protein